MIGFKKLPDSDKPRERLRIYGEENLSNEELISIIIKTGSKKYSVKEVALKILEEVSDIRELKDIGINRLTKINGVGMVKATELKAAIELGRRVYLDRSTNKINIRESGDIYKLVRDDLKDKLQECFYCLYLDNKNNVIEKKCLFIGTLNTSTVHPREVFKEAYLLSASKIICVHNHPSGDVSPSKADINLTRMIKEIGIIHGIELLDHVIIGRDKYYSFHDKNEWM